MSERPADAEYYGALFRYKDPQGAILGMLWSGENDAWRIVSYRVFDIRRSSAVGAQEAGDLPQRMRCLEFGVCSWKANRD